MRGVQLQLDQKKHSSSTPGNGLSKTSALLAAIKGHPWRCRLVHRGIFDTDPSIERHVEDAAEEVMEVEVSPEEEERLLREDSPTIMEFDISSVPGLDISGCPTVKRQVVQRPPAPSSSIVAEQDGPKRRSPVRFPSQEDTPPSGRTRERSPRKGERKYRQRPSPEKRSSPVRKPRSRSPRKREQRDRRRPSPGRRSSPVKKPRSRSPRKAVVKRRQSPRSAYCKRLSSPST